MEVSYLKASEIREKLCKILYFCRGANAIVLTQFFNGSLNYTEQQKKQMTNQLVRLKEAGIITSKRLEGKDAGSMYYLSTSGLELVYKLLNIYPLQAGTMWQQYPLKDINFSELKEYDYDTYKPPVRQHTHHHLILQSIISLFGKDSDLPSYPFRLTLDATEKYIYKNEERMLKPDVEIKVEDEIYTLEIDRSTESYSQLVAKFKNYKNYLEYVVKENIKTPITKIIFVYNDKNSNHGVSRRWQTIIKAFLEGIKIKGDEYRWPNIELLYLKVSELPDALKYLNKKRVTDIQTYYDEYFDAKFNYLISDETNLKQFRKHSIIFLTEEHKRLFIASYIPYYTSDLYQELLIFKNKGKSYFEELDSYSKPEFVPLIISNVKKENWRLNWRNSVIDRGLRLQFDLIINVAQFCPLD